MSSFTIPSHLATLSTTIPSHFRFQSSEKRQKQNKTKTDEQTKKTKRKKMNSVQVFKPRFSDPFPGQPSASCLFSWSLEPQEILFSAFPLLKRCSLPSCQSTGKACCQSTCNCRLTHLDTSLCSHWMKKGSVTQRKLDPLGSEDTLMWPPSTYPHWEQSSIHWLIWLFGLNGSPTAPFHPPAQRKRW